MRDDIHKSAPVPAHWRRLIRDCARTAGWQDTSRQSANAAVAQELNREIAAGLITHCRSALDSARESLFSADLHVQPVAQSTGPTPGAERLVGHLQRIVGEGGGCGDWDIAVHNVLALHNLATASTLPATSPLIRHAAYEVCSDASTTNECASFLLALLESHSEEWFTFLDSMSSGCWIRRLVECAS